MDQPAQNGVRVERNFEPSLALIWDGGQLGTILQELLSKQDLRVEKVGGSGDFLPKARYVFFFLTNQASLGDWKKSLATMLISCGRNQSKFFLILDNVSDSIVTDCEEILRNHGWPSTTVEIKGHLEPDNEKMTVAMGKVVRLAFSSRAEPRIVIVGDEEAKSKQYFPKIDETPVFVNENAGWSELTSTPIISNEKKRFPTNNRHGKRNKFGNIILIVLVFLLLPILILGGEVGLGIWQMKQAKNDLINGRYFEARVAAQNAEQRFRDVEGMVQFGSLVFEPLGIGTVSEKVYELSHVAELAANSLSRLTNIAPLALAIPKEILGSQGELDLVASGKQMSLELAEIDKNLGFIEGEWESGNIKFLKNISGYFGLDGKRLATEFENIKVYRSILKNSQDAFLILPEVVGTSGRKTYLIVFQNSAELRPTGGFIGSYAIVHFDSGKLLDYKINDIYTADGQLKGKVDPPDEILHYLGQPNWFMRDANFAPDFPLTAKRLEWFLEKETGQSVDGVIAVDLGAVQKILKATGGVSIASEKEKITSENFFQKAEYASEINFFPGSTQKRDFLGQIGEAILAQITGERSSNDWLALGQGLQSALSQKNIMFYFNLDPIQKIVENGSWSGGIRTGECKTQKQNCLMVVEANFGANKANYFVKQSLEENFLIDKAGGVTNTVTLNIRNESPSDSWPGGIYKNYVRFLAPIGTKLLKMDLGDGRSASVSSVLTEQVLAKISRNQFLVFKSFEGAVVDDVATTSGYTSFGALVSTPIQSNSTVKVVMELPNRLDFSKMEIPFAATIIKQPGNNVDALNMTIDYPSFLTAIPDLGSDLVPLASEQRLGYNSDLLVDRTFKVLFKR